MAFQLDIHDLGAQMNQALEKLRHGEAVALADHGKVIAKMVPASRPAKPSAPESSEFWQNKTLDQLEAEQNVKPVFGPADLAMDWPEGDPLDEFLALVREVRR